MKLKVRLHGAVAVSIEVIVAVAVAPPGTVTVVELPGRVMVEVTPPSVMVVVWIAPGPWTVVVLVLVTCSGRLDGIKQDRMMSGREEKVYTVVSPPGTVTVVSPPGTVTVLTPPATVMVEISMDVT